MLHSSESSVEIGTKENAKICGYGDVFFQVRVGDGMYRCRFRHVLHLPEFEYSLSSVNTTDLKGSNTTVGIQWFLMAKGENNFETGPYKVRFTQSANNVQPDLLQWQMFSPIVPGMRSIPT